MSLVEEHRKKLTPTQELKKSLENEAYPMRSIDSADRLKELATIQGTAKQNK